MQDLISSILQYQIANPDKKYVMDRFLNLLETHSQAAFVNDNWDWHITASMLITNPDHTKVLLMFHKKLQKWLQFGGHSDGDMDPLATAIREFHEESGIIVEPTIYPDIFDIDIHHIPADLKWRPAHQHYDILYLGVIPEDTPFARQESEVDDIRWFDIDRIWEYVGEKRMLDMLEKIKHLRNA
jgi:8-oxo-dGTP pyrophosphatase MutT (NUDIX family)